MSVVSTYAFSVHVWSALKCCIHFTDLPSCTLLSQVLQLLHMYVLLLSVQCLPEWGLAWMQVDISCLGGVDPSSHPMLKALDEASPNRDEYKAMRELMLGMLWPAVELRSTVEDALASDFFADV